MMRMTKKRRKKTRMMNNLVYNRMEWGLENRRDD